MVKHIVMWRFKEDIDHQQSGNEMKEMLLELKGRVPELKSIEVGLNFNDSDAAYDIVLYTSFMSMEDLHKYQIHPDHQKVVEYVRQVTKERVVVDFND